MGSQRPNPSYRAMHGATEAVQVEFDPAKTTLDALLDAFFRMHDPVRGSRSAQYKSALYPHGEAQERAVRAAVAREGERRGERLATAVEPGKPSDFVVAEGYHNKFYLRQDKKLLAALAVDEAALIDSHVAARVNGFVGGHGSREQLEDEIESYGLGEEARAVVMARCSKRLR